MARPNKMGLDYFPFDIDFFEDEKIVAISGEFGIKGEIVTIKLLCAIYKNGYFILWNDLIKFKLLKNLPGVSSELLDSIMNRLVLWGFFDKDLFDSMGVLTSAGIQKRYFKISKRRKSVDDFRYLLVKVSGCENKEVFSSDDGDVSSDTVNVYNNGVNVCNNPFTADINVCKNTTKKRKGNNKESSINRAKEKMGSDFGSCDIDLSELQHELSSDSGWEEAIRLHLYRNGIKVFDHDMFLLWLDKFVISLKAGGTISKDRKGFMEYFRNWILTEIKKGATNLFQDTNDALLESSKDNNAYYKFLSYIKKQAPYCFSNMRLPTEEEFLLLRDKYGNDMFKSALRTIEGRADIRSKWDVLYYAILKQLKFMKDERWNNAEWNAYIAKR